MFSAGNRVACTLDWGEDLPGIVSGARSAREDRAHGVGQVAGGEAE